MFSTFLGLLGPIDFDNNWVWLVEKANFAHLQDIWGKVLHTSRDCSIKLFSANRAFFFSISLQPYCLNLPIFMEFHSIEFYDKSYFAWTKTLKLYKEAHFESSRGEDHFTLKNSQFFAQNHSMNFSKKENLLKSHSRRNFIRELHDNSGSLRRKKL